MLAPCLSRARTYDSDLFETAHWSAVQQPRSWMANSLRRGVRRKAKWRFVRRSELVSAWLREFAMMRRSSLGKLRSDMVGEREKMAHQDNNTRG